MGEPQQPPETEDRQSARNQGCLHRAGGQAEPLRSDKAIKGPNSICAGSPRSSGPKSSCPVRPTRPHCQGPTGICSNLTRPLSSVLKFSPTNGLRKEGVWALPAPHPNNAPGCSHLVRNWGCSTYTPSGYFSFTLSRSRLARALAACETSMMW